MDSRKSQTSTATPAQPVDFPEWFNNLIRNTIDSKKPLNDYIPKKLAVAKAFIDAGFRIDPIQMRSIENTLNSQIAKISADPPAAHVPNN